MSSILTSNALIKSIKRRAFIPSSQESFSNEDFLEMATEEVNLGLVPLIQRMHEEHLIYYVDVPLVIGVNRYPMPPRAHGNKLRDVALIDENSNIFEMSRYSLNEISDFTNTTSYVNSRGFYLENNDIVVVNFEVNMGHKLRMYFYMRPNSLVVDEKGTSIQQIQEVTEVDQINPNSGVITSISTGAISTIISNNHNLQNASKIIITGSNSTPSIDGVYEVSIIDQNTFTIPVTVNVTGTTGEWQLGIVCKKLTLATFPTEFTENSLFDITLHVSPNKIVSYDVTVNSYNQLTKTLSFPLESTEGISIGNYVTLAEQTIVPNIPTELHPILAQRVAVACLEALGDEQSKQSAERKLATMERDAGTFLDNRVEGAAQKIKSRHSPLVNTLNTLGRRNRRW